MKPLLPNSPMPARAARVMAGADFLIVLFGALPAFCWLNDAPELGLLTSFLMPCGIALTGIGENALLGEPPQ